MANKQIKDFEESETIGENDLLLIQNSEGNTRKIKAKIINGESVMSENEYTELKKYIFGGE